MTQLTPFDTVIEANASGETEIPLPRELLRVYGPFRQFRHRGSDYVVANFVTTLDGVVELNVPGSKGGGPISGFNQHDQLLMGLLRAVADAVVVGAGTFASGRGDVWTAEAVYPLLANEYRELRQALGKPTSPLNVVVTASGAIDLDHRLFVSGKVPAMIITTARGERLIRSRQLPDSVLVASIGDSTHISALEIRRRIRQVIGNGLILVEGGPKLIGHFFAERCLGELFMTLSPQLAGRDDHANRPGLIAGVTFAPESQIWGTLLEVRRAGSHLFLRYAIQ